MPHRRKRILFIERQQSESVSIERVFAEIARYIPKDEFEVEFQKLKYGNGLGGLIRNLLLFRKKQADIYHITGHAHYMALVLPAERTVLTVHDLIFMHNRSGLRRAVLKKIFLDWPIGKLRYLTAVSNKTQDEIDKYLNGAAKKIRLIENPVFAIFTPGQIRPFNAERPVILQIGTTPNKNVPALIEALKGIECRLKIIGTLDDNIVAALSANGTIYENVVGVGENEIVEEYRNADIVAFCSTYEGFGLPIIEAQAMGKPVITSDREPMKGVAGDGALYVDPNNVTDIREGILNLINDGNLRNELVGRGLKNVERFAPQVTADRYCELYREILKRL